LRADLIITLGQDKHAIHIQVIEGIVEALKDSLNMLVAVVLTRSPVDDINAFVNILRVMLQDDLIEIILRSSDEGRVSLHGDLHPKSAQYDDSY
jgi:hypothetical protein